MSEPMRRAGRAAWVLFGALALSACAPSEPSHPVAPSPSVSPTSSPIGTTPIPAPSGERPFTVTTLQAPTTLDPAGAATAADAVVALNAFQRLMVVHPGQRELKPDAATDCLYTAPTVYECKLRPKLVFSDGTPVAASDVVFSLQRARRLDVSGSGMRAFDALQRVEAVDSTTVRFTLAWPDREFGYALAAPAASIVNARRYPADRLAPTQVPAGSGPFTLARSGTRFAYTRSPSYVPSGGDGTVAPALERVDIVVAYDPAAVVAAIDTGVTDVVWGGFDGAQPLAQEAQQAGFRPDASAAPVSDWIAWNPGSPHRADAALRARVAQALAPDRSQASLIPAQLPESVAAFPVGPAVRTTPKTASSPALTLTYPGRSPRLGAVAARYRDLLARAGLPVQVKRDAPASDLILSDEGPAVATPLGWLRRYLDAPLPGNATRIAQLARTARSAPDAAARQAALADLQRQSAVDLTVLPIQTRQEPLYVTNTTRIAADPFGPGWQLGLWGFAR